MTPQALFLLLLLGPLCLGWMVDAVCGFDWHLSPREKEAVKDE
jgi:hypothetical protein